MYCWVHVCVDVTPLSLPPITSLLFKGILVTDAHYPTPGAHPFPFLRNIRRGTQEHFLMSEHRRETRISARKDAVRGVLAAHAEAERDPEVCEEGGLERRGHVWQGLGAS
eukprot:353839-Chlamydomonas_euryale.AAC.2